MADCGLAELAKILDKHGRAPDRLIPILQETQRCYGYLPQDALRGIAEALGVTLAKVYGVASFYSLFALTPKGRHIIRLCESAPCHLRGAEDIRQTLQDELGIAPGETTKDGLFTLEYTSCLGVCGVAPAVMIDEVVYGNLTAAKIREIIAGYRQAAAAAGR